MVKPLIYKNEIIMQESYQFVAEEKRVICD